VAVAVKEWDTDIAASGASAKSAKLNKSRSKGPHTMPMLSVEYLRVLFMSSQVKLPISNNEFCIVQRATSHSETGIFRGYGLAESPTKSTNLPSNAEEEECAQ
jgi:hypothetical protein